MSLSWYIIWSGLQFISYLSITTISKIMHTTDSTFLAGCQLTTSIHWSCYCTVHVYVVFHFWDSIICGLFVETNLFRFLVHLFIYVLLMEIQLSWDSINRLYSATFLCLSQAMSWISNVTCHGLFVFSELSYGEIWLLVLLISVELKTISIYISLSLYEYCIDI